MKRTLVSCAMLAMAGQVGAVVIDDFDSSPFFGNAPIVDVANGIRTLNASSSNGTLELDINDGDANGSNIGVYAHSQAAGATGLSTTSYNLGGADLAADSNTFRFELVSVDLNGIVGIEVDGVSFSLNTTSLIISAGGVLPLSADFLFSDFAGVDFTNVNNVSLFVNGQNQPALDAVIDNFGTVCSDATTSGLAGNINSALCVRQPPPDPDPVPVPAPLTLLGLGLGAMMLRRRLS